MSVYSIQILFRIMVTFSTFPQTFGNIWHGHCVFSTTVCCRFSCALDYLKINMLAKCVQIINEDDQLFQLCYGMFHRTHKELPRTNNAIERWHGSFQASVTNDHSTFWKFIDILQWDKSIVRVKSLQNHGEHQSLKLRRGCLDCS